jgi:hypothetical protein
MARRFRPGGWFALSSVLATTSVDFIKGWLRRP